MVRVAPAGIYRFIKERIKQHEKICTGWMWKPLTTTFEKANVIKQAKEENRGDVIVTFNLRFQPFFMRIKELINEGIIGDILSVHFEWMLITRHGADYFP